MSLSKLEVEFTFPASSVFIFCCESTLARGSSGLSCMELVALSSSGLSCVELVALGSSGLSCVELVALGDNRYSRKMVRKITFMTCFRFFRGKL